MNKSDSNRTNKYKKNELEEKVLFEMNQTLFPKELELINDFNKPNLPVIFIVGAQRSGTTLLMQLMTQFFDLAYPNNFIARYWNVPFTGAVLYKSLSKNLNINKLNINSDLGYTSGLEGPHEFSYFWKKWFPWESWEEKKYNEKDYSILQKQLDAWQDIDNKPLIFKNLIQVDFNIEKIAELFPNSVFIHLKRELKYNIQSTYKSRINLFNDDNEWFGVKPKSYNSIKKKPVLEQIYHQIQETNQDIDNQLNKLAERNKIEIDYETIINDYYDVLNKISNKLKLKIKPKKDNLSIKQGNIINIDKNKFREIELLIEKYANNI